MFIQHVGVAKDSNKMRKLSLFMHVAGSLSLNLLVSTCIVWVGLTEEGK